jgi:CheY-like chemotaxis protein
VFATQTIPDLQVRKSSVRVEFQHVDELWTHAQTIGEAFAQLEQTAPDNVLKGAHKSLNELKELVSLMRGVSLAEAFSHYPRAVRELARSSGGKRVRMVCEFSDVMIDRGTLEGVSDAVLHLVRNAIDHGIEVPSERRAAGKPEEGEVRLWCTREDDLLRISVSDDGTGMDVSKIRETAVRRGLVGESDSTSEEELTNLVFLPGFSTRQQTGELSGRGIGLDVVRTMVNDVGGEIRVQTSPGMGTSMEITLPMSRRIGSSTSQSESSSGPRILLVDDSDITRALVGGLLRHAGFVVREAIHGRDAIEQLRTWPADMIICDLNMPVMNGIEFLTWLRQNTPCSQVPVLMLSTRGSDFDRKQAAEAGANGFVAKLQFDEAELIRAVETCLWEGR